MTIRTLLSGFLAAVTVAGCGGSAGTEASLPDSASSYIMNGGVKTAGSNTATSNTVTYRGQGLTADGSGGYVLGQEVCGIANGAPSDEPYLLWVFTATQANSATILGPWAKDPVAMLQEPNDKGTFKYISGWYDLGTLIGNVSATSVGDAKNPQLVISHGCPPKKKGAWCSPGYWIHAEDAAWALTGNAKTDLFNETVYSYFYGATFNPDPTLYSVLTATNPSPYKGEGVTGTSGCAMNAFNAVGAFLTSKLEGYEFSCALMQADDPDSESDDPCPIDHHGDWKPAPQPIVTSP